MSTCYWQVAVITVTGKTRNMVLGAAEESAIGIVAGGATVTDMCSFAPTNGPVFAVWHVSQVPSTVAITFDG